MKALLYSKLINTYKDGMWGKVIEGGRVTNCNHHSKDQLKQEAPVDAKSRGEFDEKRS